MRRLWGIHGGIHPPQNKAQSLRHPITRAPLSPELVLPLQQHSGAPAQPLTTAPESSARASRSGKMMRGKRRKPCWKEAGRRRP